MTVAATDLLLEATDISKTYGAVVALDHASLAVRPGEVHALMGANGAGKSTLVKILTGAVMPDTGRIVVRGHERISHSPADARRNGLVSVYQEPAVIPHLDIRDNLRLTSTPLEPFRHWLNELDLGNLNLSTVAWRLPLASLRIIDLARALAIEPDVLLLDEITAALSANLTERVLHVVKQQGSDRSVIFISHRLIEIAAICDRATVLRNGETVGVVDVTAGSESNIVNLMLGEGAAGLGQSAASTAATADRSEQVPRISARQLSDGRRLRDATFDVYAGEVLGVIALDGQGQDELFDLLSGSDRPAAGSMLVDGKPVRFRHPADAIRQGVVFVAADRAEALLMQRSVSENISLPLAARVRQWGWIDLRREAKKVHEAVETLQIDARAGAEVRRLSGGNQQKVTIARWVASGVRTMLCFDPTRGIDIRTKSQIYVLLRDLAAAGAAIVLYTSELKEIELACDRVIVIFAGQVVAEMPAAGANEAVLLRAAHNLKPGAELPEEVVAAASGDAAAVAAAIEAAASAAPAVPVKEP